jgi:hypothetical protein
MMPAMAGITHGLPFFLFEQTHNYRPPRCAPPSKRRSGSLSFLCMDVPQFPVFDRVRVPE